MKKISIFISQLFLFSFSIYGHSEPIDIKKHLNDNLSEEDFASKVENFVGPNQVDGGASIILRTDVQRSFCFFNEDLQIIRQCPANNINFKDAEWEKYQKEILARYQARCPYINVKYIHGSIVSITDLQDQCRPITFSTMLIEENETIPLGNDGKKQVLDRINHITEYKYNFVDLDVKVTYRNFWAQIKEGKLPIAIVGPRPGPRYRDFSHHLEIDDSIIKITYLKSEENVTRARIDAEFKGLKKLDNSGNPLD